MNDPPIAAIRSALELVEPKLSEESTSSNTEGWDSFANLNVIAEIERRCEIEVPLEVGMDRRVSVLCGAPAWAALEPGASGDAISRIKAGPKSPEALALLSQMHALPLRFSEGCLPH